MYEKGVLGYEEARIALAAIYDQVLQELSEGKECIGCSAAVVDDQGHYLAVMRMDGTSTQSVYYAIKKARSAALSRRDTRKQGEFFQRTGWRHADFADFLTTVPGGLIITEPGVNRDVYEMIRAGQKPPVIYGAIGVSGRPGDGDEALAFVGLRALQKACWGKSD